MEAVDRAYKAQGSQAVVIQADARTAREWKVRQVLSVFEMVKDKLPSGSIQFDSDIPLLYSKSNGETIDILVYHYYFMNLFYIIPEVLQYLIQMHILV